MAFVWHLLSLTVLAAAVYVGLKFPDVDQRVGFLLHRSIITHGPLLPLLAFVPTQVDITALRRLGMGVGIGFAVHMAFDLFPRAWQGYALISLPAYGWTPSVFSWIWISVTMLVSFGIAVRLCRNAIDVVVLLVATVAAFAFIAPDENALWRPLAVTFAAFLVALCLIGPNKETARSK